MAARKDPAREIRAQTQQVTLLGLKRLEALLSDPDASNADGAADQVACGHIADIGGVAMRNAGIK